jgi:hypothetical protein
MAGDKILMLSLAKIRLDGGTQLRCELDSATVARYAEHLKDGGQLPPGVVFHDGKDYWAADLFHRWHAHERAGRKHMEVRVLEGTRRDAILYAAGCNAEHGLARSDEDKRKAVRTLLTDPEWSQWNNVEIARRCRVSPTMVWNHRQALADEAAAERLREEAARKKASVKAPVEAPVDDADVSSGDIDAPGEDAEETPPEVEARKVMRKDGRQYTYPVNNTRDGKRGAVKTEEDLREQHERLGAKQERILRGLHLLDYEFPEPVRTVAEAVAAIAWAVRVTGADPAGEAAGLESWAAAVGREAA